MNYVPTYNGTDNEQSDTTNMPDLESEESEESKIEMLEADANNFKIFPVDGSFQGVNRLFLLAFDNTNNGDNKVERDSHRK